MQRKKELKMKLQLLVIFLLFGPLLADSDEDDVQDQVDQDQDQEQEHLLHLQDKVTPSIEGIVSWLGRQPVMS
jgi:hypothetical protein